MESIRKFTRSTSPDDMMSNVETSLEGIPKEYYMWATAASIAGSAYLFYSGRRWEALFVGLWAPTIINLGLFNKMLRPSKRG
ncbi:MAG: hypothetical protein NTZ05_19550 [Chloroflexi bacterium]|nr:hypothetical protein [Chloroflexota bacterium]